MGTQASKSIETGSQIQFESATLFRPHIIQPRQSFPRRLLNRALDQGQLRLRDLSVAGRDHTRDPQDRHRIRLALKSIFPEAAARRRVRLNQLMVDLDFWSP